MIVRRLPVWWLVRILTRYRITRRDNDCALSALLFEQPFDVRRGFGFVFSLFRTQRKVTTVMWKLEDIPFKALFASMPASVAAS